MKNKWLELIPLETVKSRCDSNSTELDWRLVSSIIMIESACNTWRPRFEPAYKWLYFARDIAPIAGVTYETMEVMQKTSWGLMQVMGAVAYELGLPHDQVPTQLCLPHIGIDYGCRLLTKLFQRYNSETDVIAAYNAGSPRKTSGGMYANQRYVDKVWQRLTELRAL